MPLSDEHTESPRNIPITNNTRIQALFCIQCLIGLRG